MIINYIKLYDVEIKLFMKCKVFNTVNILNINYVLIQDSSSIKLENYLTNMLKMPFCSTLIFYNMLLKMHKLLCESFFLFICKQSVNEN